jgi:hypothetical protein
MTEGGNIAKEAVTQVDISVDAATVARWLNCSTRMVRQYATNSSQGNCCRWRMSRRFGAIW